MPPLPIFGPTRLALHRAGPAMLPLAADRGTLMPDAARGRNPTRGGSIPLVEVLFMIRVHQLAWRLLAIVLATATLLGCSDDVGKKAKAIVDRGDALYTNSSYEEAVAEYSKAIELVPDLADAYGKRGNAYANGGDDESAIADFTKAIELDPSGAEAYINRAHSYRRKKRTEDAIRDLTVAIQRKPGNESFHRFRAELYENSGDMEKAIADLTEIIRIAPDPVLAYEARGGAYQRIGDQPHADADFAKMRELQHAAIDRVVAKVTEDIQIASDEAKPDLLSEAVGSWRRRAISLRRSWTIPRSSPSGRTSPAATSIAATSISPMRSSIRRLRTSRGPSTWIPSSLTPITCGAAPTRRSVTR